MQTKLLLPTPENITAAAAFIRSGGVVAIPTETVYGLAANALDEGAVNTIFEVKGRPQDNPLIVHIHSMEQLRMAACNIPEAARVLMDAFWPGPLSIILNKSPNLPDCVTAGLDSVAVRMPANPVALAVIKEAGVPLAAPSANRSGRPSPTLAAHVLADFEGRIPMIIDGGKCDVGLESTVVCLNSDAMNSRERAVILRPGSVTAEMIENAGIPVSIDPHVMQRAKENSRPLSPGTKYRHYSPKAEVIAVKGELSSFAGYVRERGGEGVFAMVFEGEENRITNASILTFGAKSDPAAQARDLYELLRETDRRGGKTLYVRCPDPDGVGLAVYNRLIRAAGYQVIEV